MLLLWDSELHSLQVSSKIRCLTTNWWVMREIKDLNILKNIEVT